MDREIIRRWNERVDVSDVVIHLGDFGFLKGYKNQDYYFDQLNGNIIVIRGNHDTNNGVMSKIDSLVIEYGGFHWWCQHRPTLKYSHNLCGHIHQNWRVHKNINVCVNVGVDQWNFYPIKIDEILKVISLADSGYN
jgi:calcineurin-like phosphoesterase family protein